MAGKKKAPVRKPAPIHAMLERPIFIRKAVLSTAIDATRLLKDLEEFRILKVQKAKAHKQLARVMRELRVEQKRLENEHLPTLPEIPHRHERRQIVLKEEVQPTPISVTPRPAPKKIEKNTELTRLNAELHDIEERLRHL